MFTNSAKILLSNLSLTNLSLSTINSLTAIELQDQQRLIALNIDQNNISETIISRWQLFQQIYPAFCNMYPAYLHQPSLFWGGCVIQTE